MKLQQTPISAAIYFSTAARQVISSIAARASATPCVALVDSFSDDAYARSSLKLVGQGEQLVVAVCEAALAGLELVDLRKEPHPAPHPRTGAVDMIAFMPLSEADASSLRVDLERCERLAVRTGQAIGAAGCPVLLFGPNKGRSLLESRRGTSFFRSVKAGSHAAPSLQLPADFGPSQPSESSGISIVGRLCKLSPVQGGRQRIARGVWGAGDGATARGWYN
uniref:Formiminotransferase N-terminal subdomain domain-containing protein n=1 Tax=Calcidiscus leptoporus TaxID=127549 RepID=A0A7S0NWM5_9EUKA|mmetsp:Transcript_34545/g.80942  ORF Transcript_34545/g.80942 Transcript_34545/m.80942 type:complete len:222 (+) Transcript_34545:54-719(+)